MSSARIFLAFSMLVAGAGSLPTLARGGSLVLLAEMSGEEAADQFGIAVTDAGDLDGDLFGDVAIGASGSDAGGDASGQVYVFLGAATPDGVPDRVFPGLAGEFFGHALSGAGDVNDDGFDDLVVGAYRNQTHGANAGRAVVFLGGDPIDTVPDVIIEGQIPGAELGRSVSGGYDLNGDGFDDIALGAPRAGGGQVLVYFGGDPMDDVADLILDAEGESDRFGSWVRVSDDVTGDGQPDLIVGAPRNSEAAVWAGKVYVYAGGPLIDAVADVPLLGAATGDLFGSSGDSGRDIDGDGFGDLAIGAPAANVGTQVDAGRVFVYYGGPFLDEVADVVLVGASAEDAFGQSVALIPSADTGGLADVGVGAPGADGGGIDAGNAAIYLGSSPFDASPDFLFEGTPGDAFGFCIAGIADMNHNQLGELLVGAWNHAGTGAAYVYGDASPGTGLDDPGVVAPAPAALRLFPNPVTAQLTIERRDGLPLTAPLVLYDVSGRFVARVGGLGGWPATRLVWDGLGANGQRPPAGVYLLRSRDGIMPGMKVTLAR